MADVVGEAGDGGEAVKMAVSLKPQLLLMDIRMPGMDGLKASKIIKELYPEIKIILYSMYEIEIYQKEAKAFADELVDKGEIYKRIPQILKEFK